MCVCVCVCVAEEYLAHSSCPTQNPRSSSVGFESCCSGICQVPRFWWPRTFGSCDPRAWVPVPASDPVPVCSHAFSLHPAHISREQALWPHQASEQGSLFSPLPGYHALAPPQRSPHSPCLFNSPNSSPQWSLLSTSLPEAGAGRGMETASNEALESLAQISWSRFNFPKLSFKSVLSLHCFRWLPMQCKPRALVTDLCSFL